ncbi:hypothetical protein [Arthrobacter sp. ES3-54]|uniref:hypothetical protein n=1 Tax=Arthrobacter sp. ES3-54 TaxID=1502991 RepID=UPI002404C939|nr:hypothetical protein [Arthrobacter sp. ES3-54]MDF9749547.1 hypothetical protein [Arthrobacter sp. ES3-54]
MFEKFNDVARRAVAGYLDAARMFQRDTIGTGHLLLATAGVAGTGNAPVLDRVFTSPGTTPENVRTQCHYRGLCRRRTLAVHPELAERASARPQQQGPGRL